MWCPALCREQTKLGKGKTRPLCFYIGAGGDLKSSLQRTVHVTFQIDNFSIREESQQKLGSENILVYKHDRWYNCGLTTSKGKSWRLPFFVNVIPNLSINHFQDDDILLPLPEFTSFLLSYLSFSIPLSLRHSSLNLHKETTNWSILVLVVKWRHRAIVLWRLLKSCVTCSANQE